MPQLTRAEMESVIATGGSVLWNGVPLMRVQDLPSEASLAQGDPEQEAAALANLQQQIADLHAQMATLQPAKPEKLAKPEKPAKPEGEPKTPPEA